MGVICRSFAFLDEDNFKLLFKALVHPNLEYASSVLSQYRSKGKEIIENIQCKATRLVPSLKGLSYEERLQRQVFLALYTED